MCKNFFLSWIVGILLSFSCGFLGSFIVWRRMSSFGNTLSHTSLLGIALSLLLHINIFYTVLFVVVILSILITCIENFSSLPLDTILGVITYSSLSLGMMILNVIDKNKNNDLTKYLFGDLLLLKNSDISIILIISIIIAVIIFFIWRSLISSIISIELSQIHGINIFKIRLIFMITTAILIGVSTKIVGALLITALLIIPPATVQKFSYSPIKIVILSIVMNILSITLGILFSMTCMVPVSPIIILIESICFFISLLI
ncbi:metal ABC transporter permease [Buchnera aphidicola]|uniref:metal ABC transporter permease n=1 Tax=Buchnera aphidicola TaxID=9 RepID=UPI003464ACBB